MAEDSRKILANSLRDLIATGQYSDLTITCKSDTYKVHRNIVCVRAEFLAGASRFPGTESASNTINLPDEDPAIVKLLIQYLYEGDYSPFGPEAVPKKLLPLQVSGIPKKLQSRFPHTCNDWDGYCNEQVCEHHYCDEDCGSTCNEFICSFCVALPPSPRPTDASNNSSPADLLVHAKMYAIADRLLVIGLKALATAKFNYSTKLYGDTPIYPLVARYVFESTPDIDKGLRQVVTHNIANNKKLIKHATIKELMAKNNGLAMAILEHIVG